MLSTNIFQQNFMYFPILEINVGIIYVYLSRPGISFNRLFEMVEHEAITTRDYLQLTYKILN